MSRFITHVMLGFALLARLPFGFDSFGEDLANEPPIWSVESNQAQAGLGTCVATAGDVDGDGYSDVAVGVPGFDGGQIDEGRVYVYLGTPRGPRKVASWSAEIDQAGARFGHSVATAGDLNGDGYSDLVVGAPHFSNGESAEGAIYVYLGGPSGLPAVPSSIYEGGQAEARLGWSVSTAGDVNGDGYSDLVAGCPLYDGSVADAGAAFIFHGSARPSERGGVYPRTVVMGDQEGGWFGMAVSTAGDVNGDGFFDVLVGAPVSAQGEAAEGFVFLFPGSSTGLARPIWSFQGNVPRAYLGASVAAAGDVNADGYADIVVGAPGRPYGSATEGRALVFHGGPLGPSAAGPDWNVIGDVAETYLGFSVSTAGDMNGDGIADLLVGAPGRNEARGSASVYLGSRQGLPAQPERTFAGSLRDTRLGNSVCLAGDVDGDGRGDLILGAPGYRRGEIGEGFAAIYRGRGRTLAASVRWSATNLRSGTPVELAGFGSSVASAGDVNADGLSDFIVGSSQFTRASSLDFAQEGRAIVYLGSENGLPVAPLGLDTAEPRYNEARYSWFGYSVSSAGDVNGDGYSDVVVGAPRPNNYPGNPDFGRAFVFYGSATGISASRRVLRGSNEGAFGHSVATAGDVDGDGYSDIVIGEPYYSDPVLGQRIGRALLFRGGASGIPALAAWSVIGLAPGDKLGLSVSSAGDVNGDGYSDILLGSASGSARVYLGSMAELSTEVSWTTETDVRSLLGSAVSGAGDVNGDGYSDIVVGAPNHSGTLSEAGAAHVYLGGPNGLGATPAWTKFGDQERAHLGGSVAAAGDVDGDGFCDLLVAATGWDGRVANAGRVELFHGSRAGLGAIPAWTADGDREGQVEPEFGAALASAGDVDGDGDSDVLVGTPKYDAPDSGAAYYPQECGRAWLYLGNGGNGLSIRPRQGTGDGSRWLQPLGLSNATEFTVDVLGRTAAGATRARMFVQSQPLTERLETGPIGMTSPWSSLAPSGTSLNFRRTRAAGVRRIPVGGLTVHWRARLQYLPFLTYSPWFSAGQNGRNEADLRVQ